MNVTHKDLMAGIYSFVIKNLPGVQTGWADYRRQDRPEKPYLVLSILTGPSEVGRDEVIHSDGIRIVRGERSIVVSFLFYPNEVTTYDGIEIIRSLQDRFRDSEEVYPLTSKGIIIASLGDLQTLSDSEDNKYGFDLSLRISFRQEKDYPHIEQVTHTIEVE